MAKATFPWRSSKSHRTGEYFGSQISAVGYCIYTRPHVEFDTNTVWWSWDVSVYVGDAETKRAGRIDADDEREAKRQAEEAMGCIVAEFLGAALRACAPAQVDAEQNLDAWLVVDAVAYRLNAEPWRLESPNRVERRLTLEDLKHQRAAWVMRVSGYMPANRVAVCRVLEYSHGYGDRVAPDSVLIQDPTEAKVIDVLLNFDAHRAQQQGEEGGGLCLRS